MGHVTHHAIVVTTWDEKAAAAAVELAMRLGMSVSAPILSECNAYATFVVGPDGSKSGWQESDDGDSMREIFVLHLRATPHVEWVEISYGSDDGAAKVERNAWDDEAPVPEE